MKGRPRKPVELKKLEGTYQPCRNLEQPMIVELSVGVPQPPVHLNPLGFEYWDITCKELLNNNLLAGADLGLVAGYCNELGLYKSACEMTEKEGVVIVNRFGDQCVNPWYSVRSAALKQATQMGQLFGITPSARARIETGNVKPASKLELLRKPKTA
jgi:P27 family predicted phage terminase small subunit